ncbi:PAS domain S-box protein [Mucilaginibacter sp. PPCGB 2223]|uniref:PAS domain S-box protein n=1 Tax=Mucilaginibacter sp. PPCGB 2223 TaxID=1886027 RepID=UPI000A789F34|nr:PAS domain S-box protein [Mucilaginibacter sp. PPCGB 2223]
MAQRKSPGGHREEPMKKHIVGNDIHFRKLIENSYSGITLLDGHLRTIYHSPSAERIAGWDNASQASETIDQLIHRSDQALVKQVLQDVLSNPGLPQTCTFRSRHYQGHYLWLECTYTNMLAEDGVNAIVCNFHDITRQKEAELLLQQTVNELSAYKYALDESAIVAITDQKGIINHVNNNFCRISKYERHELTGQDHRIINSGYHDKAFIRNMWATIANGKVWKGELRNKAKDGTYYWVDTAIVPFLDERGKPYQYVAIRSDITERKLNEEKIAASERFFKAITNNLPAMITYWDTDQRCLFANKKLLDWFGTSADNILGMHKKQLMDAAEYENCEPHIRAVLQGKPQSFYRSFHKGDDETIYTHTQYVPDVQNNLVQGFYSLICDYTEVRKAEMKIAEKNRQIENLLENITDGFIALDNNLCFTYGNKHIEQIFGEQAQNMIGKNIWQLFPDMVGTPTWNAIHEALEEKKYICNEDYFTPLSLWHENRIYPSNEGLSVFIRDITQRREEEKHLRLLESVITNTTDAVLITEVSPLDEPGPGIIYVNNAFTRMTGYTSEEILEKTPRILQGPKTDKQELKRLRNALEKAESCEVTTVNYKKNGEEFWINFSVSPVKDASGQNTHFIAIEKDITQAKNEELQKLKLAEEIAESLKEKNTVLESIGDAFFAVDKNWVVTYWNNMAEKILKTPKEQIVDKNLWDAFSAAIGSESYIRYHEAMRTNKSRHFEDYYLPLDQWFEVSAYPSEHGLSVYFKDITERKKSELQLQILNKNLQDQNEKLKEISWMQSHVIRAPLSRIMGLLTLLQDGDAHEKDLTLTFLVQSANELDDVIRNIVDKIIECEIYRR